MIKLYLNYIYSDIIEDPLEFSQFLLNCPFSLIQNAVFGALFFFFFTPNTVKAAKVSFVFVVDEMIVISVRGDTSLRLFFF